LEKPPQGRREQLVSLAEYQRILGAVTDPEFRDLVELAWETGARPHELFTLEASYVDLANARWVFPVRLSKGKKVQRVIYLTDIALAITQRLLLARTTGILLVNTDGDPWCGASAKCRFQRLRHTLGRQRIVELGILPPRIPRLTKVQQQDPNRRKHHEKAVEDRTKEVCRLCREHGTMYSLYLFRHAFCTQALESGKIDAVTVSILMGHRDTTMISRHYSHLTQRVEHLREAARKARGA
jgi:integrase